MNWPFVFFDRDGTLTDSEPGITRCVEHAFAGDEARSNRIAALGVTWGYGSHAELAAAGADAIVSEVAELEGLLLSRHFAGTNQIN